VKDFLRKARSRPATSRQLVARRAVCYSIIRNDPGSASFADDPLENRFHSAETSHAISGCKIFCNST
jgi:hypothetical protein